MVSVIRARARVYFITSFCAAMENLRDILACIPKFKYAFDETNPNKTVIRANLLSEEDATHWIRRFGNISKTNWIVGKCRRKEKT
jgi:uncharacterized protein YktB (UPF0637 family)